MQSGRRVRTRVETLATIGISVHTGAGTAISDLLSKKTSDSSQHPRLPTSTPIGDGSEGIHSLEPVMASTHATAIFIPTCFPPHLTTTYPVVRPACEAPVADRRIKRDGLTIKSHLPVIRMERRDYFVPAAAATLMQSRGERNRHVQYPVMEDVRDVVHEFMSERVGTSQILSSFIR